MAIVHLRLGCTHIASVDRRKHALIIFQCTPGYSEKKNRENTIFIIMLLKRQSRRSRIILLLKRSISLLRMANSLFVIKVILESSRARSMSTRYKTLVRTFMCRSGRSSFGGDSETSTMGHVLLDSHAVHAYILSAPVLPHDAPVRYLADEYASTPPSSHLNIQPFAPPNLVQYTSAAVMADTSIVLGRIIVR
ncbi:hypothetical protein BJ138DRAFT_232492 [Hygrophoropsis aurantiaca]|uniref:Uncharacterized protein n=1 Tax=Hygrophoropsis aurantiaca TaxID=72124 RepID=A0ACB8A8J8_9AGAM|nr:hypothetical protein BJ138DRAFT_232492 [Hygrophoropsis aurantiaca]